LALQVAGGILRHVRDQVDQGGGTDRGAELLDAVVAVVCGRYSWSVPHCSVVCPSLFLIVQT